MERDDDRGEDCETGRDQERQAVAVDQGAAVAVVGRRGGGGEDRRPDCGAGCWLVVNSAPASPWSPAWTPLVIELVSAGVGIGFASVGLQYPVLTAPDSVLRLIAVECPTERNSIFFTPGHSVREPSLTPARGRSRRTHGVGLGVHGTSTIRPRRPPRANWA
ncbi:hypothetical protein [Streptomyces sp. NBC_00878]|uniref:hypothetical protein n=1 Tax=Streptomyces sp. NBC_00878 TaxID=2975854 RepID=UPI002250616C|nr:hypothetical protein [Streptomyces sp. NBC_00878]MCX4906308.1 hypothetical protein [Streptomyces sp. NBC_00878]